MSKKSATGRKAPKQERSKGVVQAIVEAGARIVGRAGVAEFDRVTTTRIAELAGVSVGSLYQYFPNKEAILTKVIERVVDKNLRKIGERLDTLEGHAVPEAIDAIVDAVADLFLDESRLLRVLFEKASGLNGIQIELRARRVVMSRIKTLLDERGVKLPGDSAELAVFVLVNAAVGVVQGAAADFPEPATRAQLKREVARLVKNYLLASAETVGPNIAG